ncbi:MAG: hypothetical protein IJ188_01260 [Clostridia bacterium]|nr:hypothetical protein [Clostridia bacterium]
MVRRGILCLAALWLVFMVNAAQADIHWPENTEGQRILKSYVETANRFLIEQGEPGVNSLFEAYASFEVLGITDLPEAETPEKVEITAQLFASSINSLEVRVSDLSRFPRIAASFLQALAPETTTREEALKVPTQRMQKAAKNPENSFEDQVEVLNGTVPYVYYAYYPNQYRDGVNWIQMTIIFPLEGYWDGLGVQSGSEATRGPDTYSDHSEDYEGYASEDDYTHYEIFLTATPEPDSAAAEYDFR